MTKIKRIYIHIKLDIWSIAHNTFTIIGYSYIYLYFNTVIYIGPNNNNIYYLQYILTGG